MAYIFLTSGFFQEALKQIVLGIIQGLTEFLPISSTAHLIIFPRLFGWGDPGLTAIASIQLGSLIAVFIYFWNDLKKVSGGFVQIFTDGCISKPNSKLALSIFIGNLPIVFAGLLIKLYWPSYESSILRTPIFIGIVSVIMALFLALSENLGNRIRNIENIQIKDGLFVGLSQVLALIPGVSRSGITISTSLMTGLERASSARFSFLLGIPAIFLSGLVELHNAFSEFSISNFVILLTGILSASITSFYSIDLLIKFLRNHSTIIFVYYRLVFGILIIFLSYKSLYFQN
tara:strand:+ start:15128 stop:15994 length:867 start_codon:yes stop_codon:yes gene_type:complete